MADNQPTLFDSEIWKPVVGYEGLYEVSSQGRARSLDRVVATTKGRGTKRVKGKVLAPFTDKDGYQRINLCKDSKKKQVAIHRLVLESFVGPRPEGHEACHNNGKPKDNRVENLRWDSVSNNSLDKVRHGTHHEKNKTRCPRGHLLVGDNLGMSALKKGFRNCRACSNTSSWKSKLYKTKGYEMSDDEFQAMSDSYFEQRVGLNRLPE